MTDANPYVPPDTNTDERQSAIPGRVAVLSIHIALLIAVFFGGQALSTLISRQPDAGILETELSGMDDFFRAFKHYSFVPVTIVLLLDLPTYFAIRFLKGKPTRWAWLRWTTAMIPIAIVVYYIALWPSIRIPIEI